MARAFPQIDPGDYGQSPGEWQALRGELVALLDQVESQVQRSSRQDTQYQGLTERMRDLRFQVGEAEPDTRHREALLSVKRAVDRFSERDDGGYAGQSQYAPERGLPPNPRDSLQSAIQQIRASTATQAPRPAPIPAAPRLDEFAEAVTGISHRLERLEGELKAQARNQTGNVKDIAEQVGQLSHVVELLAGAVGETGQVKRLEGQIASLAKMVAQGPQVDLSSLTRRLDDVSSTVGKLAELQRAYAERIDDNGFAQRLDTMSSTVGRLADLQVQFADKVQSSDKSSHVAEGMRAIEEGVRNIYDRIDSIEKHTSLSPDDVEKLTDELTRFTEAMHSQAQPQGLVELIDALNTRIADLETKGPEIGGLKSDVDALRQAVVEAMEPRFAAIELQIEALSDRVPNKGDTHDFNVGVLEAQVRQLVARMDQTSEQLTGLAKLYQQPVSAAMPDLEALADLVASRTSDALVRVDTPAPIAADTDYEEIEKRVGKALKAAALEQVPEDFTGMREGIREVNSRLAKLEASLTDRAKEAARIEAAPLAEFIPPAPVAAPASAPEPVAETPPPRDPIAEAIAAADKVDTTPPRRSDFMPANPADDAPLIAKPFGDIGPVRSALEAKNGPRKRHPGLDPQVEPTSAAPYDPSLAATPPRPVSSFDSPAPEAFAAPAPEASQSYPADATATPSANTFIQAHRRAARQVGTTGAARSEPAPTGTASNSLISRALARFQGNKAEAAPEAVAPPRERKGVPKRILSGDKPAPSEWKPDDDLPAPPKSAFTPAPEPRTSLGDAVETPLMDSDEPKVSFITRHRRVILLGLTVAAVSILAINLVAQRSKPAAPAPVPTATDTSAIEATPDLLDAEPIGEMSSITAPRVIPMVDSLSTGSIDPMTLNAITAGPMAFAATTAVPSMPLAFNSAATDIPTGTIAPAPAGDADAAVAAITPLDLPEPLPAEIASPVKVEMPPASVGPDDLRNAAAGGDARAQFEVAAIYTEGRAVTEDMAQAAIWYERAAAQGFAPAQYRLGNLYENGKGVAKDLQAARLWYQRAAEAGNRMSMHNLAALYAGGELGKQEFDSAARWFEQAAARGMKDSQFNLGMLYARGLGVKQDMEASFKWFSLAANRGDADAAKARDDIARSLGADSVARLNAEIATWQPQQVDMAANYAPIGTWSAGFDPGEQITKKEVVLNVQMALNLLGYDVGTPDGMAGPKTAEAIKAFERATGMTESGAINPRLLAVLGSQPV